MSDRKEWDGASNGFCIVLSYNNLNRRTIHESRQLSNVDLAFASASWRGNEEIELVLLDVRESVERENHETTRKKKTTMELFCVSRESLGSWWHGHENFSALSWRPDCVWITITSGRPYEETFFMPLWVISDAFSPPGFHPDSTSSLINTRWTKLNWQSLSVAVFASMEARWQVSCDAARSLVLVLRYHMIH